MSHLKTYGLVMLCLLLLTEFTRAQNNYTIYRSYGTRLGEKEQLSFEYIEDKKNDLRVNKIFQSKDWFNYTYIAQGKIIAQVSSFDSLYYDYVNDNSAIVYRSVEGQTTKHAICYFNHRNRLLLTINYGATDNEMSSYTRNTYLADTLVLSTANYQVNRLWEVTDTVLSDSIFYTYDALGRKTGEYPITQKLSLDTFFVHEYTYQDTLQTTWHYDCYNRPCKKYARLIETFDADQHILEQKYYNVNGELEEVVKYTYETDAEYPQYKNTASVIRYSAKGRITQKTTFRRETIKK
jgi:hypothetical protein